MRLIVRVSCLFLPFCELALVTNRLEVVHKAGLAEAKSEQVQRTG